MGEWEAVCAEVSPKGGYTQGVQQVVHTQVVHTQGVQQGVHTQVVYSLGERYTQGGI